MPTTTTGPTNMKIHKKTGSDTYVLYHPQTGADVVLYNGAKGLPWETTPSGVVTYTSQGVASSTGGYYLLEDILRAINTAIDDFGGVLEFKGTSTIANLPTSGNLKGEVYIVTNSTIYWSSDGTSWKQYPSNTLFACVDDTGAASNYINSSASASGAKTGWIPLGGNNDIYAKKTEAIGSVTQSGGTITFNYVSGGVASTVTFNTIGTVPASTTTITSDINSAADSAIPNVAAIKSYAGSAGYIDTVAEGAEGSSYYLVGAAISGAHTHQAAIGSDIKITHHTNGNDSIAVDISGKAATAGTADMVANGLTIDGLTYNGSAARTVTFGNGIFTTLDVEGSSLVVGVNTGNGLIHDASSNLAVDLKSTNSGLEFDNNGGLGVDAGNGITLDSNGVNVKLQSTNPGLTVTTAGLAADPGTGITLDGNGISIAGTHTISAGSGITITGTATYRGTGATTTVGVKGDASKGITVDASAGVGINAGNGIGFSNNQLTTKVSGALAYDASGNIFVRQVVGNPVTVSTNGVTLDTSGIAAGVYSAIEVDTYGLAKSGGQAVVFAENMQDHDLESLVIGGLAFVGNEASATDSIYTTNSGSPRIG